MAKARKAVHCSDFLKGVWHLKVVEARVQVHVVLEELVGLELPSHRASKKAFLKSQGLCR